MKTTLLISIFSLFVFVSFAQNPFLNKLESKAQQYIITEIEEEKDSLIAQINHYINQQKNIPNLQFSLLDSTLLVCKDYSAKLQQLRLKLVKLNSHLNIGNDDTTQSYAEKAILDARQINYSITNLKGFPYSELEELLFLVLNGQTKYYRDFFFLTELLVVKHQQKLLQTAYSKTQKVNTPFSLFSYSIQPAQRVLMDGEEYKADIIFHSAGLDESTIKVEMGGEEKEVVDSKISISFPVQFKDEQRTKEVIAQYKTKQSWKGSINIYYGGSLVQKLIFEEEYFVVWPMLMEMSATGPTLYRGLVNEIKILIPSLSNDFEPTYKLVDSDDELIVNENNPYIISIIPGKDDICKFEVYHKNLKLGLLTYKVYPVPAPYIALIYKARHLKLWEGLYISELSHVYIKAYTDEYFRNQFPKEMRYKVYKYLVEVYRNEEVIYSKKRKGDNQIADHALLEAVKPGDVLKITTEQVKRKSSIDGKIEGVEMDPVFFEVVLK